MICPFPGFPLALYGCAAMHAIQYSMHAEFVAGGPARAPMGYTGPRTVEGGLGMPCAAGEGKVAHEEDTADERAEPEHAGGARARGVRARDACEHRGRGRGIRRAEGRAGGLLPEQPRRRAHRQTARGARGLRRRGVQPWRPHALFLCAARRGGFHRHAGGGGAPVGHRRAGGVPRGERHRACVHRPDQGQGQARLQGGHRRAAGVGARAGEAPQGRARDERAAGPAACGVRARGRGRFPRARHLQHTLAHGFRRRVRRGGCPRPAGHARRGRAAHRLALRAGRPRRGCGLRQRGGGGRRAHVARGLCRRARARCGGLRRRGRGRGGGAGRPRHRGCHCTGRIPPAAGGVREGRGRGECGRRGGRGRPRRRRGGRRRRGWGRRGGRRLRWRRPRGRSCPRGPAPARDGRRGAAPACREGRGRGRADARRAGRHRCGVRTHRGVHAPPA